MHRAFQLRLKLPFSTRKSYILLLTTFGLYIGFVIVMMTPIAEARNLVADTEYESIVLHEVAYPKDELLKLQIKHACASGNINYDEFKAIREYVIKTYGEFKSIDRAPRNWRYPKSCEL